MGRGAVHTTLRRLAANLTAEGIPYAIIGGMALNLHGFTRETLDVDILLTPRGLKRLHERLVGRGYTANLRGASKTIRDAETRVPIEIITTGEFPGDGKPKPVAFPDPAESVVDREGLQVLALERLIELKLASGLSAPHRLRDLADVQDLIVAMRLPLRLREQLDPSVRAEYERLWRAARTAR